MFAIDDSKKNCSELEENPTDQHHANDLFGDTVILHDTKEEELVP